jgi:hypothetical protein
MKERKKRSKIDRSTSGVVEHAPRTKKPAPVGALSDRHTVDSSKRAPMRSPRKRR